ncbi:hypothetical protein pipiens_011770 [Culex pipiens pipiens]|uniref:Luciferin 4-monooxygenase n=1 Tax=Culex pipiens pipiens TaxID=38569 RepID=A0ABD1D511_CULPP
MSLLSREELNDPNIIDGGPLAGDYKRGSNSLGELILRELTRQGDKVAFVHGITSLRMTFGGILDQSLALACYLREELGVRSNDVVALVSENRFEYPVTICALMYLGARAALFNPLYTARELEHCIGLAKPKVIFVAAQTSMAVQRACVKIRRPAKIVHYDNGARGLTYQQCLEDSGRKFKLGSFVPEATNLEQHVALIVMSSGTTGLPKGVQITQLNVITTLTYTKELLTVLSENAAQMVAVDVMPWFHVAGGVSMLNWMLNGMQLVFIPRFNPRVYLSCIHQYRPNMLNTVPPIAVFLAKSPLVDEYDLSSVKTIICGAAPLSREVEDLIRSRLNVSSIRQAYGMSETTLAILVQMDEDNLPGSVGKVRAGQYAKVVDTETGKTLGPDQNGELCFKGTLIMKGYIGKEDAIDKQGWLRTGDVGYYDKNRNFYIVDRLKELIKYKAFQVPPAELEALLLTHPKVKDAAVIGVPNEKVGELATAFIVPAEHVHVTPEEIAKFLNDQVSIHKRLHGGVRLIHEIPKTASGKILRRNLRELAKNKAKL